MELINNIANSFSYYYMQMNKLSGIEYFFIFGAIFITLAIIAPSKPSQPLFRKDMVADILYWFLGQPLIYGPAGKILFGLLVVSGLYSAQNLNILFSEGTSPLKDLPILLQAFLILVVMDIIQYWTHRLFHGKTFWKFHAIHHAQVNVDWLTCVRFHPVNLLIHSTCVFVIVQLFGFSPLAWAVLVPFNTIYSPLVHANLNWTYGPFRYVLASPVFHRWHHTYEEEGGNKNFAPTFPILDIIFGTYYDPKGVQPKIFGAQNDKVPDDIIGQLKYPFEEIVKEFKNGKIRN
ncbi:MAG: sterol desaturase family protein [Pseudomonadota bacterium]